MLFIFMLFIFMLFIFMLFIFMLFILLFVLQDQMYQKKNILHGYIRY